MKPDEFEQQLRNLPLRPVPADWRAEMLIVARVAGQEARSVEREVPCPWWREWLWPCPQAWAGLAAVWLLLIGLHWGTPSPSSMAKKSGTEQLAGLAAQRRELTRLLDVPLDPMPATESPGKRSPRSMAEPRANPRAEVFSDDVRVVAEILSLQECAGSETGVPVRV